MSIVVHLYVFTVTKTYVLIDLYMFVAVKKYVLNKKYIKESMRQ